MISSGIPGAGASSISFWWRRCAEQSRVPRQTQLPWLSAMNLHLDVAGLGEVALDVALVAAEVRERLALGGLDWPLDLVGVVDDLHAAAAAAVGRLDRDRPAVLVAERR